MTGLDRALPGHVIDRIRDGVPPAELRATDGSGGGRAVWKALVSTAASAWQRGWDREEWEALLDEPASRLGAQSRTKDGTRPLTPAARAKTLGDAWNQAQVWVSTRPAPNDRADMRKQAESRARALLRVVEDPATDLRDVDRAVLAYTADLALTRGIDRLALPWREVMAGTGYGERAVKNALRRLTERQMLTRTDPGRAGGPEAKRRRAALYRIPDPEALAAADLHLYPETGSVGPPRQVYGTPLDPSAGTPARSMGPVPNDDQAEQHIQQRVAITTTSASGAPFVEELAKLAALLDRHGYTLEVEESVPDGARVLAPAALPPSANNVTALRPRLRESA